MRRHLRLGEILVETGVLTPEEVERILAHQRHSHEPFGVLGERLFGLDPEVVEDAWAHQYASMTRTIDPAAEAIDERAAQLVTRRQAWQFRVLPIRFEGEEAVIATTPQHLCRALRFATRIIGVPVCFVMADARALGEALSTRYPLPGMSASLVESGTMDDLFGGWAAELAA